MAENLAGISSQLSSQEPKENTYDSVIETTLTPI